MSLPTAHSYILRELKKNIDAIHSDFLKPEALIQHLSNIETTLNRDIQNLDIKDFSNNIDKKEKVDETSLHLQQLFYFHHLCV